MEGRRFPVPKFRCWERQPWSRVEKSSPNLHHCQKPNKPALGLRMWRAAFIFFVSLDLALPALAQPVPHAKVELLADQSTVAPEQHVLAGIHFVLEDGWHIYWINPGDSGQPPSLQWKLPPGASAGEILWPQPQRIQDSSEIVDYGYQGEVVLLVPLYFLTKETPTKIELVVDAKWLICRDVCLPEHMELRRTLPVSSKPVSDPSVAQLFARAKQAVPKPLPSAWRVTERAEKENFVLTVNADHSIRKAQFFPLQPNQIENSARQVVRSNARGAIITLKKSDLLTGQVSELQGVLETDDHACYKIVVPVKTTIERK